MVVVGIVVMSWRLERESDFPCSGAGRDRGPPRWRQQVGAAAAASDTEPLDLRHNT